MATYCKDKSCKYNACHHSDEVRCHNHKNECTYEKYKGGDKGKCRR